MDIENKLVGSEGGAGGGGAGGGGGGDDGGKKDNGPPKPLPCPRCNSSNTKFCYYNDYNKLQPRFFCKGCRRYWTQGGALRNIPVGGGCRKSKRPKTGPSSGSAATQQKQPPPPGFEFAATTVGPSAAGLTGVAGTGGGSSNNNNNNFDNSNNMMFGGVRDSSDAGFFLSPLNFGPNMGLLHGFGLPGFHPNSNQLFQNLLYSTREIGSSSNSVPPVTGAWNLDLVPPTAPLPPLSDPNNIISSSTNNIISSSTNNNSGDNNNNNSNNSGDNNNNRNNNNETNQWAEYMGNSGIKEP